MRLAKCLYAIFYSTVKTASGYRPPMNSEAHTHHLNRRHFLTTASGAVVAASILPGSAAEEGSHASVLGLKPPYSLPKLPFALDALEPHIDAMTMEIHHGKHHAAYVKNLNEALAGDTKQDLGQLLARLSDISDPKKQAAIRNNGGGHFNHTFFWNIMAKPGGKSVGGEPKGKVGEAISKAFGGFDAFKAKFNEAGLKRFGSGWAWLIKKPDESLAVTSTPNQDNPLMKGLVADAELGTPLLGVDVWEHAYYLKYQNRRPDYLSAWWSVVNWEMVESHFSAK